MFEWLLVILAGIMAYSVSKLYKRNPEMFRSDNVFNALSTFGLLAIFLIFLVVVGIMFLGQL